ncbi:MAG TPA: sigma-70 family RNA polymerase sigma factor [Gemmatimonadales bacterium]
MADTRELVERARLGNTDAFDALVRRYYRAAYAVALGQVGNAMDAEDVCQDAFIKALERLEECRDPDRFGGWLLQIVRNRARNFRDYRRVRDGVSLDDIAVAGDTSAGRSVEREDLRQRLETALATLNEAQREVVLLHDLEGWKHREIAESMSISEVMARQHLFVARRKLRESLGARVLEEYINE